MNFLLFIITIRLIDYRTELFSNEEKISFLWFVVCLFAIVRKLYHINKYITKLIDT